MGYDVLKEPGLPRAIRGSYRLDTLMWWDDAGSTL
jgi:hypothetical protein